MAKIKKKTKNTKVAGKKAVVETPRERAKAKATDKKKEKVKATDNSSRPRGEKHPRAKLSDKDIKAIRKAYKSGVKQADLARHYEISVTYTHKIVHGQAR